MANDKYLGVITSEHNEQPNFVSWLTNVLNKVEDVYSLNIDFDIDTAVGSQLDIIGEVLGRNRTLTFQPTDGSSSILDDKSYRTYLKGKVLQNQWDGTINGLAVILNTMYPDYVITIVDNQDMTMTVTIIGNVTVLEIDLIQYHYFMPKPAGVNVTFSLPIGTLDLVDVTIVDGEYVPIIDNDTGLGDIENLDIGGTLSGVIN